MITQKEIRNNCKEIHLRNAKCYFKTKEFEKWVNDCIDLARENGNLYVDKDTQQTDGDQMKSKEISHDERFKHHIKIDNKIRNIIKERIRIIENKNSCFSTSDHCDRLYADLEYCFRKLKEIELKEQAKDIFRSINDLELGRNILYPTFEINIKDFNKLKQKYI